MPGVAALLGTLLVAAGGPPVVAVFDIEDRGAKLNRDAVSNLTDYLSAKLTASGAYHVIPNEQVRTRLRSQKAESYKTCYDQSCQIEIGKELAAGKSISTKLLRIGKTCVVTVSVYDLSSAATEHAATHEGKCDEEGVMASIGKTVEALVKPRGADDRRASSAAADECRAARDLVGALRRQPAKVEDGGQRRLLRRGARLR